MLRLACANNGRNDSRLTEQPGERNLRKRDATLSRDLTQAIYDFVVGLFGL
jgi:hypothetical protein